MSEYTPTAEQVNAFKAAWHDADDCGQAGKLVEIALAKVLGPACAAARREGQAEAWEEAYAQGVDDERISEDNIGIAGLGGKVAPCRRNPYRQEVDQ